MVRIDKFSDFSKLERMGVNVPRFIYLTWEYLPEKSNLPSLFYKNFFNEEFVKKYNKSIGDKLIMDYNGSRKYINSSFTGYGNIFKELENYKHQERFIFLRETLKGEGGGATWKTSRYCF